jgi:hypothetical protein
MQFLRRWTVRAFAALALLAVCSMAAAEQKPALKCNTQGKFKIVQFTDTHWGWGKNVEEACKNTLTVIDKVLDAEKPDLVMFTGDVVIMKQSPLDGWKAITEPMVRRKIPWATVLGNHDDERHGVARRELVKQIATLPGSLTEQGPDSLGGTGNYILTVAGTSALPAATLYCLDSNAYPKLDAIKKYKGGPGKYAWISFDQIRWYRDASRKMHEANAKIDPKQNPPALAFFHIPLQEYNDSRYLKRLAGAKLENGGICPGVLNSGMFTAMLEQGDMLGVFVGHDHNCDYAADLFGICLAFGRCSGFGAGCILPRGARVIELTDGRREFDSWIRLVTGDETERFHFPANATKAAQ